MTPTEILKDALRRAGLTREWEGGDLRHIPLRGNESPRARWVLPQVTTSLVTLEDWIPTSNPKAGENFYGIDRAANLSGYSGHRLVASPGYGLDLMVRESTASIVQYSGQPTFGIFPQWAEKKLPGITAGFSPDLTTSFYLLTLGSWVLYDRGETLVCTRPNHNAVVSGLTAPTKYKAERPKPRQTAWEKLSKDFLE